MEVSCSLPCLFKTYLEHFWFLLRCVRHFSRHVHGSRKLFHTYLRPFNIFQDLFKDREELARLIYCSIRLVSDSSSHFFETLNTLQYLFKDIAKISRGIFCLSLRPVSDSFDLSGLFKTIRFVLDLQTSIWLFGTCLSF